jgi:hypothetical protein
MLKTGPPVGYFVNKEIVKKEKIEINIKKRRIKRNKKK